MSEGSDDAAATGATGDTHERPDADEEWCQHLADAVPCGIYRLDGDHRITAVNDALTALVGRPREELVGEHLSIILSSGTEFARSEVVRRRLGAGGRGDDDAVTVAVETAGGDELPCTLRVSNVDGGPETVEVLTAATADAVGDTANLDRHHEAEHYRATLANLTDTVLIADEDGRLTWVCPNVDAIFGYSAAEVREMGTVEALLGPDLFDGDELAETGTIENVERQITDKHGESHDLLVTVKSVSIGSGTVLYACRDVTERTEMARQLEHEQELEHYRRIVETVADGIYVLDSDRRFMLVNEEFTSLTGYDRDELIGAHAETAFGEKFLDIEAEKRGELQAGDRDIAVLAEEIYTAAGTPITVESRFTLVEFGNGETGRVGVIRDITDQVERERELEESRQRYQTLVDNFPNGAVVLFDEELTYVIVGGQVPDGVGLSVDELQGKNFSEILPPPLYEEIAPRYERALAGESSSFEATVGEQRRKFHVLPVRDDDGEVFAGMAMSQDVTDERERERELQTRIRQQSVVTQLGQQALATDDLDSLFDEAVTLVAETLDNDYCKVLEGLPGGDDLLLRAGVGWRDGLVGTETVPTDRSSQAGYTLLTEEPVVVPDMTAETRFSGPDLLTRHGVESGISTIVGPPENPWGILGTHDTDTREYTEQDVDFVQATANILTTAISRVEHERQIEHQREQLAALNNLNGIIRDIIRVLIQQSTRADIEQLVCDRLADSESYEFAWVGSVDNTTDEVLVRTEAGVQNYLDDITITVDDSEDSQGPTGRAFRTGKVQVCQDVTADPAYEKWRDRALEYGYRSSVAIPITYENTTYGVLNVYADRPAAFGGQERDVVEQLGEVMAHAINGIERKRLLMSDEVVEIEFSLRNVFDELALDGDSAGEFTIEQLIPVGQHRHVAYGTVTADGVETMERLVENLPSWEKVTMLSEGFERRRFELHLADPPALGIVTGHGGHIPTATFSGGDWRMTVELPPEAPVRDVVDAIQEAYASTELLAQRRTAPDGDESTRPGVDLDELLTDRQAAVLKTAYAAGFFEWPRESTGEDVAETLGISAPTFHQHLRTGERAVLATILDEQ